MSRKRKSENVAQYFSQAGCDGLRQFVTSSGLSDLSGCDELARERLISAVKVGFLIFDLLFQILNLGPKHC